MPSTHTRSELPSVRSQPAGEHDAENGDHTRLATPAFVPEPPFTGTQADLELPGGRLPFWDTGLQGPTVVLLHPHTCDGAVWSYQHAGFAARGYRTVAYSRRGHGSSATTPQGVARPGSDDLEALRAFLGVERMHLLGAGAGGAYAIDYALRFPARVATMILASSMAGLREPAFTTATDALLPPGWNDLPVEFRELGPSYRASAPAGTRRYAELTAAGPASPQPTPHVGTFAALSEVAAPTLLITGGADLYLPPPRLRELAGHMRQAELVVLPEAGHAGFWEYPQQFNDAVLDFLDRHRGACG